MAIGTKGMSVFFGRPYGILTFSQVPLRARFEITKVPFFESFLFLYTHSLKAKLLLIRA